MNKIALVLALVLLIITSQSTFAEENEFNYENFANTYFEVWTATQSPGATKDDIEKYLSLLTDDVGHQHAPNDPDDIRYADGKTLMREGMMHYLAAHTSYQAKLIDIMYGANAVAIKYEAEATYKNQDGEPASWQNTMLEVLEIENGKVSVIRKYSE